MSGSMDSKQKGTFPYSYKREISEDQTMQNRQALSMSVSYIIYSGSFMESIHIEHLENLWDSEEGVERRGLSRH